MSKIDPQIVLWVRYFQVDSEILQSIGVEEFGAAISVFAHSLIEVNEQ